MEVVMAIAREPSPENLFDEIYLRIIYLGQKSSTKQMTVTDDARIRRKRINMSSDSGRTLILLVNSRKSWEPRVRARDHR